MALPIALGASLVGSIFGAKDKNPGRLATNQQRYDAAVRGDAAALDALWLSSGRKVAGQGWATAVAKDDAWAKYQAVKGGTAAPPAPVLKPSTAQQIGNALQTIGGVSTGVGQALAPPPAAPGGWFGFGGGGSSSGTSSGTSSGPFGIGATTWLLVGLVLLVAVMFLRRGR